MSVTISAPHSSQMIVTLENNAMVSDIKKALRLIKGIASVRMARITDDNQITPALYAKIKKARQEYANGEAISCSSIEEMQQYFDSL